MFTACTNIVYSIFFLNTDSYDTRKSQTLSKRSFFSCATKKYTIFSREIGFKVIRLVEWTSCSSHHIQIENNGRILKRKIYTGGQQFANKNKPSNAILDDRQAVSCQEYNNFFKVLCSFKASIIMALHNFVSNPKFDFFYYAP